MNRAPDVPASCSGVTTIETAREGRMSCRTAGDSIDIVAPYVTKSDVNGDYALVRPLLLGPSPSPAAACWVMW